MSATCPLCHGEFEQLGHVPGDHECLTRQNAALKAVVEKLRAALCPYCAKGNKPVNGMHAVEQLCECEPNEYTNERSVVRDWVICEVAKAEKGSDG